MNIPHPYSLMMVGLLLSGAVQGQASLPGADEQVTQLDTIQVQAATGSRIARAGYEAPTPVTILEADALFLKTPGNIADALNTLPTLQGSISPMSFESSQANGVRGGRGTSALPYQLYDHAAYNYLSLGGVIANGPLAGRQFITGGDTVAFNPGNAIPGVATVAQNGEGAGHSPDCCTGQTGHVYPNVPVALSGLFGAVLPLKAAILQTWHAAG